jgi:hypothetical protein
MERKLSKVEFKAIRKHLKLTSKDWAELLNVSHIHVRKIESFGTGGYEVTNNVDRKVKSTLEELGLNLEELLKTIGGTN